MGEIVLVGGGVRSGKSAFALRLARRVASGCTLIATAEAGDDEMRERINRHRCERTPDVVAIEAPLAVAPALCEARPADAVVIDCLTLWLSNHLLRGLPEAAILQMLGDVLSAAERREGKTVIVTNEVGMGIVPETALGRSFRDLAGRAHQRVAARASRIYFAALGVVLRLRPAPIEISTEEEEGRLS